MSQHWRPYPGSEVADEFTWRDVGCAAIPCIARCAVGSMIAAACESPIEVTFGAAVLFLYPETTFSKREPGRPALIPQWKWRRFRIDWALFKADIADPALFVECDGAEFHSTPEQLANDRRKDAAAKAAGIPLLRFTGSDIYRNYDTCAHLAVAKMMGRV